jgi:hypothetical protein
MNTYFVHFTLICLFDRVNVIKSKPEIKKALKKLVYYHELIIGGEMNDY